MLFLDMFKDNSFILWSVCAFAFLCVSTFYPKSLKYQKGFILLLIGMLIFEFVEVLKFHMDFFLSRGVSFKIFALSTLFSALLGSSLMLSAASQIWRKTSLEPIWLFSFITIILIVSGVSVFVFKLNGVVSGIETALPVLGLGTVFLSLICRKDFYKFPAEVFTAFCIGGLAVFSSLHIFLSGYTAFFSPLLVLMLAFSYMFIRYAYVADQLKSGYDSLDRAIFNVEKFPLPIVIAHFENGKILSANAQAMRLFRLAAHELPRYRLSDFFVEAETYGSLCKALAENKQVLDVELLAKGAGEASPFWLLSSFQEMDYHYQKVVYAVFQNISIQKKNEKFMQTQLERDPLTGIYNRHYFDVRAQEKMDFARENKKPFAVVMLDIDHFKKINDQYGHKSGDQVLIKFASICEETFRYDDLVARYGGDEFVVFLNDVTAKDALIAIDRLRQRLSREKFEAGDGACMKLTVSIGIAPSGIKNNLDALLKMADLALYTAKNSGRNKSVLFDSSQQRAKTLKKNPLKNEIHPAFSDETAEEISLLDGVETNRFTEV